MLLPLTYALSHVAEALQREFSNWSVVSCHPVSESYHMKPSIIAQANALPSAKSYLNSPV